MSIEKVKVVLTGGRAGFNGILGKQYKFVDGALTLRGSEKDVQSMMLVLERSYAAYPEGSAELEAAQRRYMEATDGECNPTQVEEENPEQHIPGDVQPQGQGSPEEETVDGGESDDSVEGQEGSEDSGDGHEDPRVSRIREAVMTLEVPNDALWTAEGLPKVEAVSEVLGEDVTRAEITAAAPNFNRQPSVSE